ncbi:hypothetical protein L3V82_13270 [Thiotrichales bacterium 19S3-7]|nr:hypothetical protein [Thiotrichales bacterium 19S3-7]MCF6803138.1 hypothetical protein [Thiotrichales bacterium 19S3-11]
MLELQQKLSSNTVVIAGSIIHADESENTFQITSQVLRSGEANPLEYHKRHHTSEKGVLYTNKKELDSKAGEVDGLRFDYRGLKFGLEICYDHDKNALKGGQPLDVQILIADGQCPRARNTTLVDGGLFIHCELNSKNSSLSYERKPSMIATVTKQQIPKHRSHVAMPVENLLQFKEVETEASKEGSLQIQTAKVAVVGAREQLQKLCRAAFFNDQLSNSLITLGDFEAKKSKFLDVLKDSLPRMSMSEKANLYQIIKDAREDQDHPFNLISQECGFHKLSGSGRTKTWQKALIAPPTNK